MGVGDFDDMLNLYRGIAPMRRNITADEVGKTGMALLSNLSSGITGEVVHVDCGFSIMGAPPADFFKPPTAG
jgi:enoyl-[acyl-carrier protein] reductase I